MTTTTTTTTPIKSLITHPEGCSCKDRYYECGTNWRNCERVAALFVTPGVEFSDETLKKVFHVYGGYPFIRMRCLMKALHAEGLLDGRVQGLCMRLIDLLDDDRALDRKAQLVWELGGLT